MASSGILPQTSSHTIKSHNDEGTVGSASFVIPHDTILTTIAQCDEAPSFGNITMTNCSDTHFGNKMIYQGSNVSVTIKNIMYGHDSKKITDDGNVTIDKQNATTITLDGDKVCFNNGDVQVGGLDDPESVVDNSVPAAKENAHEETTSGVFEGLHRLRKLLEENLVIVVSLQVVVIVISLIILIIVSLVIIYCFTEIFSSISPNKTIVNSRRFTNT